MKKNRPLISVIVATHNNSDTIVESLNSIFNQNYQNFEVLVVDDASEDDTLKKLNKMKNDKLKVFSNSNNIGLTKSLNLLIKESKGDYIARHDSDDISFPNRFSEQINAMRKKNKVVCTTRAITMQTNKIIPGKSFYISPKLVIRFKNPFVHGTLMIKKSCLEEIGFYDESFYYAQDYKLFSDLIKSKYKIINLKKILYSLNTENNISSNFKDEQNYFANKVKKGMKN